MFIGCSLYLVGALILLPLLLRQIALGADFVDPCVDLGIVRAAVNARSGKLIELTQGQWQFLRDIYAMSPESPAGLPYGGRAMLATSAGGLTDWCFS